VCGNWKKEPLGSGLLPCLGPTTVGISDAFRTKQGRGRAGGECARASGKAAVIEKVGVLASKLPGERRETLKAA
jgi:hypothetical protein